MKATVLIVSVLVLASLQHNVQGQSECGSWVQSSLSVNEANNFFTLTAQFSSPSMEQRFLEWNTTEGSATATDDFIGGRGILTFGAGDVQEDVLIFLRNDQDSEPTEQFFVDLLLLDGTLCDTAIIEIIDDEPPPTTPQPPTTPPPSLQIVWEQSKYTFIEGEDDIVSICAGPPGGASLSSSITVTDVMIEGMTATFQEDFFAGATNEWVFTPANPFQCLTLFIANDVQFEGPIPETIRASFIQDALLGPQEALICIVDDEPVIAIEWELDVYMFDEGGNSTYQICAVANDTIIGDRVEERFVVYRNGSATAGLDYVDPGPQLLRFEAGDVRMCVYLQILDDNVLEPLENFFVDLVPNVQGLETSTAEIRINDDEGQIMVEVEQEIYTVVEGNYLEVCVVIVGGGVAAFPFNVTGTVYFPRIGRLYYLIYFSPGDSRMCDLAFFPGNSYLDSLEREEEIIFVVQPSEFSSFVSFDRDSASIFLADDDLASIGFSEPAYTAMEDGGSVRVCLQLCEGSLNRPIDVLLYTDDGTALEGTNYEGAVRIVTLLASGVAGDLACTNITILDDGLTTGILNFSLSIFISDTHVLIPDIKATATVSILPVFEICFDMDSPRVNGSELFLSFESTVPVDSAICSVDSLTSQDCTSGSALFTFNDTARTEMYDITIVATLGSETRTLQNSVRSELTAVCDAHLINKGVLLDGNNATIYLQPTGPDAEARILDLECRCRPNDLVFMPCPPGTLSDVEGVQTIQFQYIIPAGCTRLSIRQVNDGRCSPRRALQLEIADLDMPLSP